MSEENIFEPVHISENKEENFAGLLKEGDTETPVGWTYRKVKSSDETTTNVIQL
jgi:hypothetical protein